MLRAEAEKKARYLVGLLQGTMALEGQGLNKVTLDEMIEKTTLDLMKESTKDEDSCHDSQSNR